MGRALLFLLAVALTAAVGAVLLRPAEEPAAPAEEAQAPAGERPAASAPLAEPEDELAALPPEAPPAREIVPRASRNVTPPGVTPGPPVTGPLVRVPTPPKPEPEPPPPQPRVERLFRPVVDSAGALTTAAGRISLAGIEAPEPEATCGEGSAAWPCGRVARAELMRFIRGRAIECHVPPGEEDIPESTRCSVAGTDIGEWLVRQGWARPAVEAYADAAREAEEARRGLWGDGPR
jgi:endonuclease YncB( thermonuclease family)